MMHHEFMRRLKRRVGRRIRVYGVGPGKTGSHSLTNLFSEHYRAAHEPEPDLALDLLVKYRSGQATERQLVDYIRDKDRRLRLEVECAGYDAFLARILAEVFPDALFVVTVRDCFTWANSAINQLLNNPTPGVHWRNWRDSLLGPVADCSYTPEEAILARHGMWNLDRLLASWSLHYHSVLDHVPPERIMLLPTADIGRRIDDLAAFCRISPATLTTKDAHAYKAPLDHGLLAQLPTDFVDRRAADLCGDLMARFYPDDPCNVEHFCPTGDR